MNLDPILLEGVKLLCAAVAGAYAMRAVFGLMITYAVSDGILMWKGRRYRIDEIGRRRQING